MALLPTHKKSLFDELQDAIEGNTSSYYAIGTRHIAFDDDIVPAASTLENDNDNRIIPQSQMLFGKRILATDIVPMIRNIPWEANTVYTRYDHTQNLANTNFYVIAEPEDQGGDYRVYKCLDNNDGSPSTELPALAQIAPFTTSDSYMWKYMYSITTANYEKFATVDYAPVFPNTNVVDQAYEYSGLDVFTVANVGGEYSTFTSGTIRAIANNKCLQIDTNASDIPDYYTKSDIYVGQSQLRTISQYVSNTAGNWVFFNKAVNTEIILPNSTQYSIAPSVRITGDGDVDAEAIAHVNTETTGISSITVVEPGYGYSHATVNIVANSSFGAGANVYAIIPASGGHGSNPAAELNMIGYGVVFSFDAADVLPTGVSYSTVAIIKNPYALSNIDGSKTENLYANTTFSQVLAGEVASLFDFDEEVTGESSGAVGKVAFANSTHVFLTGDKYFTNNEIITGSTSAATSNLVINTRGSIYAKDVDVVYVQNNNKITRVAGQSETFKLIIKL